MKGYPFGAIKRLDDYEEGAVSTLYICFKLKDLELSDFYLHYFESGLFNQEIYTIAQEGARSHGLLNLGLTDFFSLLIPKTSKDEAAKIVNILNGISDEINNLNQIKAKLVQQKQGLMQQLLTGKILVNIDELQNSKSSDSEFTHEGLTGVSN